MNRIDVPFGDVLELLKDTYPFMEPQAYVQYGNGYIFNLVSKQDTSEHKIANFCVVNPKERKVSNCLPLTFVMRDQKFYELWKTKRITIKKKLSHSLFSDLYSSPNLSHHGVKGQSWGIRNGPPYPLNQKIRERLTRKHAIAKKRKTMLDRGRLFKDVYDSMEATTTLTEDEKVKKTTALNRANEEVSRKVISDISNHRVFDESHPPKLIRGPHSIDDDMARVNPKFDSDDGDTLSPTANNCGLCAFAYDLRRRGYDVTAKASVDGIQPRRLMKDIYKDAKMDFASCDSWDEFFSDMPDAYPEGSRGILGLVTADNSSGHAVNFEVKNGKFMVIDSQINDRHTAKSLSMLHSFDPAYIEIIRTDNLDVNLNQMHKVVNEYKDGWEKTADRNNPNWKRKGRGRDFSLDDISELFGIDLG